MVSNGNTQSRRIRTVERQQRESLVEKRRCRWGKVIVTLTVLGVQKEGTTTVSLILGVKGINETLSHSRLSTHTRSVVDY